MLTNKTLCSNYSREKYIVQVVNHGKLSLHFYWYKQTEQFNYKIRVLAEMVNKVFDLILVYIILVHLPIALGSS